MRCYNSFASEQDDEAKVRRENQHSEVLEDPEREVARLANGVFFNSQLG
jgi:hypothetical protein